MDSPKIISKLPPRHICIAAALTIASGVGSIIKMIAGTINGDFGFDLGFVGIPIGYGLLIGRSSSRNWALFFSGIGLLGLAGIGVWTALDQNSQWNRLPYFDKTYAIVEFALIGAGCQYVFAVLFSKTNLQWFEEAKQGTMETKAIAWSVAAVSVALLLSYYSADWWTKQSNANLYPIKVRVTPYNSVNGKGVASLSYGSDDISIFDGPMGKMPKIGISTIGGIEGMQFEYKGIANAPVKITIKSDGFHDKKITLDKNTKNEIRVAMEPIELKMRKGEYADTEPSDEDGLQPAAE